MCVLPLPRSLSLSPSLSHTLVRFSKLSSWPARQWSSSWLTACLAGCSLAPCLVCLADCLAACLVSSLVRLVRLWSGGQLTLSYICMCSGVSSWQQLNVAPATDGDGDDDRKFSASLLPPVIPLSLSLSRSLYVLPSWLVCPFPAPGTTFCLWQNNSICWLLCLSI